MNNNDFVLDIIARLNKQLSKRAINDDLKTLDNTMYVKVLAKLSKSIASRELKKQLKELDNLYVNVGIKTDKEAKDKMQKNIQMLQKSISDIEIGLNASKVQQKKLESQIEGIRKNIQKRVSSEPLEFNLQVKKDKLISDIEYTGKRFSKLFSSASASKKYEEMMQRALAVTDKGQLSDARAELAAFTSEIKASGLASKSLGDRWRDLLARAKDLFSAASIVRVAFTQVREAVSAAIDLDKVYTDLIKVQSELTRSDYPDYLERCNRKAQELATTQKALIEGAEEFSKSGYDLDTSDKLTEKSTVLANVGEMSAADSAKAIISSVQAYDVVDGYTDVADKAQALIDKYNELGNTASITTKELAQGVQSVGSVFADANTSVDEFLSLLSAGNRQYQNADSLALALRTSALRIRGASVELEAAGEDIEGVMSTLDNQKAIKALTGVDILESDQETIRSIYDIFLDISKVYHDMSDVDQSALLDILAGKHRASAISATLNNMTEAEELLQKSLHANGSAQREYDTYLESTEAHLQQFQSKLVETYSGFVNGDMVSNVADLGTAILDLVNKTDLLKHSLIAIATIKIGQCIVTVGGAIAGTVTQMNTLGNAIQQIKNLPLDEALRENALKDIGVSTQNLTEKNLKLLLSQKQLEESDRFIILGKHNLTKEQAKEKLETLGLTNATNANTAANTANATSANTLKGAFTGLTASIKATWAAMSMLQKASIIFAAISTAWSIGSSIIESQKQKAEEAARALEELSSKAEEAKSNISNIESSITSKKDSLDGIAEEYAKLAQGVDLLTNSNKNLSMEKHERFLELSNQLSTLFPSLTKNYDENGNAILDLSGDVNTITSSLYRLLDVQKKIAEQEILDNMPDVWAGYQMDRKNEFIEKEHANSGINFYAEALQNMLNGDEISAEYNQTMASVFDELLNTAGLQAEDFIKKTRKFDLGRGLLDSIYTASKYDFSELTETQKRQLETAYQELTNSYKNVNQNAISKINGMDAEMQSYLYTWLSKEFTYQKLNSADTGLGTAIQQLLYDSLNYMPADITSWDEATSWFEENILFSINNIDDTKISKALSDIYTNNLNSGELLDAIAKVQGYFGLEHPISISLQAKVDDTQPLINNVKEKLQDDFDDKVGELTLEDLQIAAEQVEVPEGTLLSWDELIAKIKEASLETGLFESFSDTDIGTRIHHITDLFNEGSISHKEYFDALQSEIDNFDASNFTDSIEDMNKASAQFFVDSMQQTADGLSSLINSFDNGEMSISEYLEGYLAIGNTLNTLTDDLQENSAAWNEHGEAISEIGNTALDDTQNKLNSAMSVIESYQDSIYSLEQIMNDAVTVGSDEFKAHANVIAEDLYRIVQSGGEMADTIASTLGTTTSEIAKSLTENVSNQEIACQAIAANTNTAIGDMATSIGQLFDTLGDAISNFKVDLTFGVSDFNLKKVVLGLLGVQELPEIKFSLSASGKSLDAIGSAISSFGEDIASSYKPQTIDLDDFHFGSTEKGKNRKYTPSSGVTKNYENALDKTKDSAKGAKAEYEELFNFFEQRIKVLDDALSLLKSNLDNVTGSLAKNNLIDAELGITEEKFKNYSDALAMYTQKANEALSKLPSDIASKIKDGAVDLTTFIGDGNKDVVEAIKDYEQWADKVADCKRELAELKTAIRQLELEKFNNIMDDFSNQFEIHENGKELISKQIDLLEEAGQLIGESFFSAQIEQSKKQLALLEAEKAQLVEQMSSAIGSGRVQKGTDEWLEMVNALSDVEGNILDCKKAIEEFDNQLLQLHWDVFDRIQGQFEDIDSELSNIRGLFEDSKITDDNFNWSREGLAQMGLLTQQYELAQYQVQKYNDELNQLNSDYLAGKYSATEYADKLSELSSAQWDAVNASESIKAAIVDLNETRVNEEIDAIEKEIDAYRELIDSQIEALKSAKDLHDYQERIAEKTKSITDLERQIAAMANDDSAASVAKRKQLEEQLAEAKKELESEQYNHSVEEQENALNKQFESYEEERNKEIDTLKASLENQEALISASFEAVKNNADIVGQEIAAIATQHGITISDAIINSWQNGENAIANYGFVLSEQSSAFIGNIMGVENEIYSLQYKANETANSLAWMFGTRADTLVNELTSSYYSEQNLNTMTQALQNSLINTLEGGYNISGISNALNGIASGLDNVASSAQNAANAINSVGASQAYTPPASDIFQAIKDTNAVIQPIIGNTKPKKKPSGGGSGGGKQMTMMAYAKGGIIKKDADNPLNRIAESVGEDTLVAAKEGESILTERQTAAMQKLAELFGVDENGIITVPQDFNALNLSDISNPKLDMSLFDSGISRNLRQPEIISSSSNKGGNVNVNYGSLITVNGDINDTKHFLNDMQHVAQNAIKKSWHDFEMTRKYGSY